MTAVSQTIHGLPLTHDLPVTLGRDLKRTIKEQKEELEEAGVRITGVHIVEDGSPPRFFIEFLPGKPSFETRSKLEGKHYDVGQQMAKEGKMLRFYASKKVTRSDGWD